MPRAKTLALLALTVLVLFIVSCAPAPTAVPPTSVPPTTAPAQPTAVAPTQAATSPTTAAPAAATKAVTTTTSATTAPAQAAAGKFTLYTSEAEDKVNEMVNDFKQANPGVSVDVYRSGTGEVEAKIQTEAQAGEIKADAIWFADDAFFKKMADEDRLMQYVPKGSEPVPSMYKYGDGRYYEVRLIFNVVAYNTNLVKTPPTSWNDLYNPQYKGKVAMASPFYSGAAFSHAGTFVNLPAFGWDFYQKLKDNGAKVEQGNGNVQTKLASGEYAMGILVDFMARDLKTKGSPVDHIWPAEGALMVPTPIGIIKTTKNAAPAKAFMDYMFTERAQKLFVKQSYVAVVPGMPSPANTPDMSKFKVIMVDSTYIASHRDEIGTKFNALFGGK